MAFPPHQSQDFDSSMDSSSGESQGSIEGRLNQLAEMYDPFLIDPSNSTMESSSDESQAQSRLMNLPAEIRERIWQFVIGDVIVVPSYQELLPISEPLDDDLVSLGVGEGAEETAVAATNLSLAGLELELFGKREHIQPSDMDFLLVNRRVYLEAFHVLWRTTVRTPWLIFLANGLAEKQRSRIRALCIVGEFSSLVPMNRDPLKYLESELRIAPLQEAVYADLDPIQAPAFAELTEIDFHVRCGTFLSIETFKQFLCEEDPVPWAREHPQSSDGLRFLPKLTKFKFSIHKWKLPRSTQDPKREAVMDVQFQERLDEIGHFVSVLYLHGEAAARATLKEYDLDEWKEWFEEYKTFNQLKFWENYGRTRNHEALLL